MKSTAVDPSKVIAAAPAPRALSVVVADDERDTVLTLMALLRHEGHAVHGVYKGDDVVPVARNVRPDAIIIDIGLPGMSGYAVARELRALYYAQAGAPLLIGISGQWMKSSDRVLAELVGFDHYLVKPCDPGHLLKLLEPLRDPYAKRPADPDATVPQPG
jgi:DNA-binding response OmpR family regulator